MIPKVKLVLDKEKHAFSRMTDWSLIVQKMYMYKHLHWLQNTTKEDRVVSL